LTEDHTGLESKLQTIQKTFGNLSAESGVSQALSEWVQYQQYMLPHLKEEEEIGLPLVRAYFTPADIEPLIMKAIKASPNQGGGFIYFCGVEKFRNEFMIQEGIPWFVWYIDFRFQYKLFKRTYVDKLEAVKKGEQLNSFFSRMIGF
jgi:hypothetical protein